MTASHLAAVSESDLDRLARVANTEHAAYETAQSAAITHAVAAGEPLATLEGAVALVLAQRPEAAEHLRVLDRPVLQLGLGFDQRRSVASMAGREPFAAIRM
jgi:hypothetical protein